MRQFTLLLSGFLLWVFAANAQEPTGPKSHRESISKIKIIFEAYSNTQDLVDSEINKGQMKKSLENLGHTTDPEELELLVNVWMYYDPADFPARQLVLKVLEANKPDAIIAVKKRIKNKKADEKKGSAPYSEIDILLKELKGK